MSAEDVDEYLLRIEEPKRSTLEALRRTILEIVPDAEQVISYRVPAFRLGGETVAGFDAFRDHLSYLPFSGSVLSDLADELQGYTMTKSALHFPVDRALPKTLVGRMRPARPHASKLPLALGRHRASTVFVKPHAPAAPEDPVIALHQRRERRPGRLVQGFDRVLRHDGRAYRELSSTCETL
jgi:uncharacterized protein YdhG (YjbR/CyaY superfamily)